ncbi:hypothetical protein TUSST3_77700 [Streptomyces sp. TUS-ST3]|nr:hypothetical protein TUSST3_77700 [Streptomyces sp. TUS-ST3]
MLCVASALLLLPSHAVVATAVIAAAPAPMNVRRSMRPCLSSASSASVERDGTVGVRVPGWVPESHCALDVSVP